jgi:hypothetical protein
VLVELIMAALVIAYVVVTALGHGLLVAAIYKCLRDDYAGGRARRTVANSTTMADDGVKSLPA